jgi:hypothetical protein
MSPILMYVVAVEAGVIMDTPPAGRTGLIDVEIELQTHVLLELVAAEERSSVVECVPSFVVFVSSEEFEFPEPVVSEDVSVSVWVSDVVPEAVPVWVAPSDVAAELGAAAPEELSALVDVPPRSGTL